MEKLKVMELKVSRLDRKAFAPYGEIIGPQKVKPYSIISDDIDFYPGISNIELTKKSGAFFWLDVKRSRKFICENLERHLNSTEAFIPFAGSSICVFALSENMNDPKSSVSIDSMKAFFMDGSLAVNLKKGTWHWIPFPISDKASFIGIFENDTHKNDLEIIDLKKNYNLSVKLILEK